MTAPPPTATDHAEDPLSLHASIPHYDALGTRELALVAVALAAASPRDPERDAARAGIAALDGFLRRVGQRPTLTELGVDRALIPVIAQDAVDDAAIANSPRLPARDQVETILRAVAG
jgi:alcohol dehydrogenase class IV